MDDMISRKAAVEAVETKIKKWNAVDGEGYHVGLGLRYTDVIDTLTELPSAQPEPCVNTIDALNESIKHFDDMAEECRRNANIERNDYMDMRDDAAEYRQLSIWLNELKWLRERFQSQPEIVRCKDCKWMQGSECVRFAEVRPFPDDFCSKAERRTDATD